MSMAKPNQQTIKPWKRIVAYFSVVSIIAFCIAGLVLTKHFKFFTMYVDFLVKIYPARTTYLFFCSQVGIDASTCCRIV